MGLARRPTLHKTAVDADLWHEFEVGQQVMTREGVAGTVTAVNDGPFPGNEEYEVELVGGLGGGRYAPGELHALDGGQNGSAGRTAASQTRPCSCCNGSGTHYTASSGWTHRECYTCDGSGYLDANEKQASCDAADPGNWPSLDIDGTLNHVTADMDMGDPGPEDDYTDRESVTSPDDDEMLDPSSTGMIGEGALRGVASEDYPELGTILYDRPPPENDHTAGLDLPSWDAGLADMDSLSVTAGIMDKLFAPGGAGTNWAMTPTKYWSPGHTWSYDWCRFRNHSRCYYPERLDEVATRSAGYAVWVPKDRGTCPRGTWDQQKLCPVGAPGPHSGDPHALTDASQAWNEGGQRGGHPGEESTSIRPYRMSSIAMERNGPGGNGAYALGMPAEPVDSQGVTCPYCWGQGSGGAMPIARAGGMCGKCHGMGFLDARMKLGVNEGHDAPVDRGPFEILRDRPNREVPSVVDDNPHSRDRWHMQSVPHEFEPEDPGLDRSTSKWCRQCGFPQRDIVHQVVSAPDPRRYQGSLVEAYAPIKTSQPHLFDVSGIPTRPNAPRQEPRENPNFEQPSDAYIGKYLYHHSPPENRQSILTHGLTPHDPQESSAKDTDIPSERTPEGVYLGPYDHIGQHRRHHDIWAVDTNKVNLEHDPDDEDNYWGFHYSGDTIPPHAMTLIHRAGEHQAVLGSVETTHEDWGQTGNRTHITREEKGTLPTEVVAHMPGVEGEIPGQHRNKTGDDWESFKSDIERNGIQHPIFITVDHGEQPRISEGNHRRDAAVELGHPEVPVHIRYFGNAQDEGSVLERHQRRTSSLHDDFRFHFTATWSDVRAKAKRIRSEGHVAIQSAPRADNPYISALVQGDNGTYETRLMRSLGGKSVAAWECGCKWAEYSWGRTGRWKRFEGRMCSHALATLFEAQAQEMFGGEVKEVGKKPLWQVQPTQQPWDPSRGRNPLYQHGSLNRSHPLSTDASLSQAPIVALASELIHEGIPLEAIGQWVVEMGAPITVVAEAMQEPFKGTVDGIHYTFTHIEGGAAVTDAGEIFPLSEITHPDYDPHSGLDYDEGMHFEGAAVIHPGYSPEGVANPLATHFESLPKEHQDRISGHVFENSPDPSKPLTHEQMVSNIVDHARRAIKEVPGAIKTGVSWYRDAHRTSKGWAKQHGMTHVAAAGAMAALSPNSTWESNVTTAHYLVRHLGKNSDERFRFDPEDAHRQVSARVVHGDKERAAQAHAHESVDKMASLAGKRFHDMTHEEAASALFHQAKYTDHLRNEIGEPAKQSTPDTRKGQMQTTNWSYQDNVIKAVRIARGEHPDKVLSGHKVRSFYNNIIDPHNRAGRDSVTIDSHAVSAAANAKYTSAGPGGAKLKKLFEQSGKGKTKESGPTAAERSFNARGTYSFFAHAYRDAHKQLKASGEMPKDSHPHDLQAVVWNEWKRQMDRKRGADSPFPVISALDEVDEFFRFYADMDGAGGNDDESHRDSDEGVESQPEHTIDPWGAPDDDEPDPDIFPEENAEWHRRHPNPINQMRPMYGGNPKRHQGAVKGIEAPSVAGVAVKAKDTGRVLLIQRSIKDSKDPAAGTWEFPGGHLEDGEDPFSGGKREWQEEMGHPFPEGSYGGHWTSPNGTYQGHVWVVPSEDDIHLNPDRENCHVMNPDDPDRDDHEVAAWHDIDHLPKMPALRSEVKQTPWPLLKSAVVAARGYQGPVIISGRFINRPNFQGMAYKIHVEEHPRMGPVYERANNEEGAWHLQGKGNISWCDHCFAKAHSTASIKAAQELQSEAHFVEARGPKYWYHQNERGQVVGPYESHAHANSMITHLPGGHSWNTVASHELLPESLHYGKPTVAALEEDLFLFEAGAFEGDDEVSGEDPQPAETLPEGPSVDPVDPWDHQTSADDFSTGIEPSDAPLSGSFMGTSPTDEMTAALHFAADWHNSDGYSPEAEGHDLYEHIQEDHPHFPVNLEPLGRGFGVPWDSPKIRDILDDYHKRDHDEHGECGAHEAALARLNDEIAFEASGDPLEVESRFLTVQDVREAYRARYGDRDPNEVMAEVYAAQEAAFGAPQATVHEEPEPALPETDGADPDAGTMGPESRSWLMGGHPQSSPQGGDNAEIAAMARASLAKMSAKDFTPAEQQDLINEGEGVTASNLDRLDIAGTHYMQMEEALQSEEEELWLA